MIFIDTGAFCAFCDRNDQFHVIAVREFLQLLKKKERLVTSNFVIDETYTWVRYRLGYKPASEFLERVRASQRGQPALDVVTISRALEDQAIELLKKYSDQDLSYTDATSFAIIKDQKVQKAFSFDRHFQLLSVEIIPRNFRSFT